MMTISKMMEAIPGSAAISPPTTRRSVGTTEMRRITRRIRSARSTEKPSVVGSSAMATTKKSNRLHGSRKKRRRNAKIRSAISTTKTARMMPSISSSAGPTAAIT